MGSVCYEVERAEGAGAARLLYVTVSSDDATWHSTLHSHGHAEIFYCVSGQGRFNVGGADVPVRADTLVLVGPHTEHTEFALPGTHLEYVVLGVQGVAFTGPEGAEMAYRTMDCRASRDALLPVFRALSEEAEARRERYAEVCGHLLQTLLIRLQRHEPFQVALQAPDWAVKSECQAVKRFIDDHFCEDLDLDALAARTHLSRFYLAHAFQKEFGVSPISYLTARRIREARHLLTHTDHSMAQISRILGFSSQSYFSQCFRRVWGATPGEYRRLSRQDKA